MIADFMRNSHRVLLLCSLIFVGTFALAGMVLADVVTNRVDSSIDNERETLDLVVGGPSEDVAFRVVAEPLSVDGDAGCNFEDDVAGDRLEVGVNSSNPEVASLNRSAIAFNDCGVPGEKILRITPLAAGTTNISFSSEFNNTGGSFDLLPARFTVSVKHQTNLSVDAASGVYGGTTDLKATLTSASGSVGNKTIDFTLNGKSVGSDTTNSSGVARLNGVDLASANGVRLNAGTYGVGASFAGTGTYLPSSGSSDLTVNQAAQSITFGPLAGKTYGDAPFEVSATSSSGLRVPLSAKADSNCTVSPSALLQSGVSVSTVTVTGAGSCTVVASRPATTNYSAADSVEQRFDIAKARATITLSGLRHTYDGSAKTAAATTDPAGLDGVSITYDDQPTAPKDAGSYTVVASLSNPNYEADSAGGTLTIAQKALSVAANDGSREYGEPNPDLTGTLAGVADGDNITASYSTAATQASGVGPYPIVPSLDDPDNRLANYDVTKTDGTLTVARAPLGATAADATKVYGDALGAADLTGTLTGVKNGDPITVGYSSTGAASTSEAGSYPIVPAIEAADAVLANYEAPVPTNGSLTVEQAPITIKADDASRYYGEPDPAFGYSVVSGDFKNGDLGNGVDVSLSSTATPTSQAGTYNISVTLSGARAGNYALDARFGTLTVLGWASKGFFSPVDSGTTQNTVKNGSTVPLKFRVFKGAQELTSTSVVSGLKPTVTNCQTGAPVDNIEELATGGTSLRYDSIGGQFIFNWQTPKKPGACYSVTVQMADGTLIPAAKFWLK